MASPVTSVTTRVQAAYSALPISIETIEDNFPALIFTPDGENSLPIGLLFASLLPYIDDQGAFAKRFQRIFEQDGGPFFHLLSTHRNDIAQLENNALLNSLATELKDKIHTYVQTHSSDFVQSPKKYEIVGYPVIMEIFAFAKMIDAPITVIYTGRVLTYFKEGKEEGLCLTSDQQDPDCLSAHYEVRLKKFIEIGMEKKPEVVNCCLLDLICCMKRKTQKHYAKMGEVNLVNIAKS